MADRAVVYKETEQGDLKLHIFNPVDFDPSDARPAIAFFFGGGWVNGNPEQFFPHSQYLASRGLVAISAEYRVEKKHGTSPQECVRDGKSAIRWIRAHASELGIDPQRLAAGGGSAGGHVAAAAATVEQFNEEGEDLSISCRPNALVLFNPVFDNGPDGWANDRVAAYWQDISPLHNISEHTPPSIVFLGTEDVLIPVATVGKFKELMEKAGGRCEAHFYEGQPHGFFNFRNREYFDKTVIAADKFLASLGYVQGEPTLSTMKFLE
ncbi:MAG: acetyl esterase [Candidatus Latescibacterota bacterium]|jgi:acetyl esterase